MRQRPNNKHVHTKSEPFAGVGLWTFFALMYLFTSDTVQPVDKLEFFWRMLAGPLNFLNI